MRYTLTNCTVLTVDEHDSFYPNGAVSVESSVIKAVGNAADITPCGEVVDMGGALIAPGLINTHTHSHSSIFRNTADDLRLMEWLETAMWPMEKRLSAERAYAATALSCLEYMKSGITTYADQFYYADIIAQAAKASGLRCLLGATVFSGSSPETGDTLKAAVDFVEKWRGREDQTLIYPALGPHAPYSVSAEIFREISAIARRYGLVIHTHISETAEENAGLQEKTGMSPAAWLESLGVFENKVLAAHCVHLSGADLDIFAANRVSVSYNPVSNLKLVSGIMNYRRMKARGIVVGMGTDGAQSNNSMDLLRDMRTGALLQKHIEQDAAFFTARESVRMMTIDGARALFMGEQIGSLEPGKCADIIALDSNSPRACPLHRGLLGSLYGALAYSLCGADVTDVMVGGRWLMRGRKPLLICESDIYKNAQQASEYLIARP
ncbi:MAG: amidohydrolase [Oscillospiraceae bacterium]|nr:amidohydrolase [Oscillospiraceae bacterium]